MEWRIKVELFEEIRRQYEFGEGTIQGVAQKLGIHRRMVRQAIRNAIPPRRKTTERPHWKLKPGIAFINGILAEDRKVHRKQRHTAHRIWTRLKVEFPDLKISERMVRRYVRKQKQALGMDGRETFVPQSYPWGSEGQVDWYEAWADLGGERTKLQAFSMRSMASGASFHRAYLHATQQAFLEAHELAFQRFGGVFAKLRYDNLGSAVKRILRGSRREETARFIAFRSHWGYEAVFCSPGEGHEKGGVEGEIGYFRRNHWVPIPVARDLDDLNRQLLAGCEQDEARTIEGRQQLVGQAMMIEREHLRPLPTDGFDLNEVSYPRLDGFSRARVRTNFYSVPRLPGTEVEARVGPMHVEFRHQGTTIARHERCYGRQQEILDLEHYLDALEHKPGALAGSKPLEQWRRQGRWPSGFDEIWQEMMRRNGRQPGTRRMIELIRLGKEHGYDRLREAVEMALGMGSYDVSTVRYLLTADELNRAPAESIEVGSLSRYERPLPVMDVYDQLLSREVLQ